MLLASAAFLFASCEEIEIPTYGVENLEELGVSIENANAVRFPGVLSTDSGYTNYSAAEDLYFCTYSFLENPLDESTEYVIPVITIGNTSDVNRAVNVTVDAELTTAPAGSYEIVESVIPAGKGEGYIRIKIANTPELLTTNYELVLKLQPSADFKVGPADYLTAKLMWNNILPAPTVTNYKRTYNMMIAGETNFIATNLNCYSTAAHLAIVAALGWDNWGDKSVHGSLYNSDGYNYLPKYTIIYNGDKYKAYVKILEEYLAKYEAENGAPLLHDGGKLVGTPVQARKY